jgi:xanthine dehydrogenase accessory factor
MALHRLTGDALDAIVEFIDRGRLFAVALVLRDTGSTPRKAGTRALIDADGGIWGTVGGGLLEATVQQMGIASLPSGHPALLDFPFAGAAARESDPVCGGRMRVLIDPHPKRHQPAYREAVAARRARRGGVLITRVKHADPIDVEVEWRPVPDQSPQNEGTAGFSPRGPAQSENGPSPAVWNSLECPAGASPAATSAAQAALELQAARYFCDDPAPEATGSSSMAVRTEGLVEPIFPAARLIIIGGGHVGQALAAQAAMVGFEIVVIEDRPEFADAALFPPGTLTCCGDVVERLAGLVIDAQTYLALVSRGHLQDAKALRACVHAPAAYIGMMGSRRKVALLRKDFIESGVATAEQFDRIHAPIGLPIGAATVPEIACSIVAELIAARRRGDVSAPGPQEYST